MRAFLRLLLPPLLFGCSTGIRASLTPPDDSAEAEAPDSDLADDSAAPDDSAPPEEERETPAVQEETVPEQVFTHMPVFRINTGGNTIGSSEKVSATLEVIRDHDGTLTDLDSAPLAWEGPIGIEIHGSSSSYYPKLGYRFETRDETGEDRDVSLLDLPAGSDWVLSAPYCDKSLLRNAFAYRVARILGEDNGEWQPRTAFAELYLNNSYQGVYLLVERVHRGEDRVDIAKVAASSDEGDVSGGYIVKVDQHRGYGFDTAVGTPIDYVYPRYADLTSDQDDALSGYFDAFEAALLATGWDDPATGYPSWIVVDSWVDHYIVNELANNIDAYRLSAYLYKEADPDGGLLHAGPVWDFDRAFGNVDYCYAWRTKDWVYDALNRCGYAYQYPFWWQHLLGDSAFQDQIRCRWESLRAGALSDAGLEAILGELADEVAEAEVRDAEKWDNLGVYVSPNYYVGETWADELDYLTQWTLYRATWIDENLEGSCAR